MTLGFVAWSLWLLGVRDWRCYPVALLWPFTREAVEFGAIGPLLLLIVAFLWRYRDSTWGAATATASAVAAKLFLWPLALWLRVHGQDPDGWPLDRRHARARVRSMDRDRVRRTEAVPGVAPGGRGSAGLPLVQRHRARALARRLIRSSRRFSHLLLGVALLALAFRAARNHGMTARDRDRISLGYVLAAALVLTPVVWPHYLVLLLAPLALARPRLSALWLFVLAATVLYAFDWYRASPEGEWRPVVVITALVAIVFVGSLRPSSPKSVAK